MRATLALLVFAAGCGSKQSGGEPAGPDCPTVAAHLVELAERDNAAEASASLSASLATELERSCRDQAWSSERRTCLAAARSQDETLACPTR
jgi:hypothetical protein